MAKLIELKEAAERLGITPDELTEMRSRNEIFGYRDGTSWKFKPEEIERVANEMGLRSEAADISDLTTDATSEDELIDVADLKLDDDSSDDESVLPSHLVLLVTAFTLTREDLGRLLELMMKRRGWTEL